MCAGRDNEGARSVVPDDVAWRELPFGKMIGDDKGFVVLFMDSNGV